LRGDSQRLDKWLFFARIIRTRRLAAEFVSGGRVRVNREKVSKPATEVGNGDVLTLAIRGRVRVLRVLACAPRRGSTSEAELLYEEVSAPQKDVCKD
jgi:ribosome-associated heat shock protein Hsp15